MTIRHGCSPGDDVNGAAPEHLRGDGPVIDDFPGSQNLVGLALSGGGVRSATFTLGALQALHERGVLRLFDYLSTVSGGGFTGAWWSAWLSRVLGFVAIPFPPAESLEPSRYPPVVKPAAGQPAVPVPGAPGALPPGWLDPVHHLRLFANYLTPRRGVFSADTWRGITFYLRTLVCTWAMLLPLILAAVMAAQWFYAGNVLRQIELGDAGVATAFLCSQPDRASGPQVLAAATCQAPDLGSHRGVLRARLAYAAAPLVLLAVVLLTFSLLWLLHATAHPIAALFGVAGMIALLGYIVATGRAPGQTSALTRVAGLVALLAVVSHVILVIHETVVDGRVRHDVHRVELSRWQSWTLSVTVVALLVLAVGGFGHELVWFVAAPETGVVSKAGGWGAILAAAASAVFAAFKLLPSGRMKDSAETVGRLTGIVLLVAPYIVLGVLLVTMSWLGWWLAATWSEHPRVPAPSTVVVWASFFPLAFAIFEWVVDQRQRALVGARRWGWWTWQLVDNAILGGAVMTVASLLGVRAMLGTSMGWLTALAHGALGFSAGFLLSSALNAVYERILGTPERTNGRALLLAGLAAVGFYTVAFGPGASEGGRVVWAILVFVVLWVVGLGWMVDPNLLSMQNFYRARLIRAYLGATNPERPAAITQESARDDVPLTRLGAGVRGGPYHLVNTTLNLAGARDLAAGQRPAANFIFSRYFCGSGRTAYRWTDEYMGGGLTLGTAMGISGAAASPSMGRQTPSIALTMLMALLNVRLGSWMPNPARGRWREGQAHLWPFYLA